MNKEYHKLLGMLYAMTEVNFQSIFAEVLRFLDSKASHELKAKTCFALLQMMIEHYLLKDSLTDQLNILTEPKYRDLLIEVLNQKSFINLFLERVSYLEGFARLFLPKFAQLFSEETVCYVLNRENIPPRVFAFFASHPVILKNLDWQKKYIKYFHVFPIYIPFVYITDQAIEEADPEDVHKFLHTLAFYKRPRKISCSPDTLKRAAYSCMIMQNDWMSRYYVSRLDQMQLTYNSVPEPVTINVDPNKYSRFELSDFVHPDTVHAAVRYLNGSNLSRVIELVDLFLKSTDKNKSMKVYNTFRAHVIRLMRKEPRDTAYDLYFNCKSGVVYALFHDEVFMKVVNSLKKRKDIHSDFEYYTNEIAYYYE